MRDISDLSCHGFPSRKLLLNATAVAAVATGAPLVTDFLTAEYVIDPTRLGKSMGLTVLSSANAAESEGSTGPASAESYYAAIGPV